MENFNVIHSTQRKIGHDSEARSGEWGGGVAPLGYQWCRYGYVKGTATRKDGSKNSMVYYCCGVWKNKGSAVCHSNMIRVEKANDFVYQRLEEIMTNDKFFCEVVSRANREHEIFKTNACKERAVQERKSEKTRNRQKRNYESYEDGLISKEEFLSRIRGMRVGYQKAMWNMQSMRIN